MDKGKKNKKSRILQAVRAVQVQKMLLAAAEIYGVFTLEDVLHLSEAYGYGCTEEEILGAAEKLEAEESLLQANLEGTGRLFFHPALEEMEEDTEDYVQACLEESLPIHGKDYFQDVMARGMIALSPYTEKLADYLVDVVHEPEEAALDFVYDITMLFRSSAFMPLLMVQPVMEYPYGPDLGSYPKEQRWQVRQLLVKLAESIPIWMQKGQTMEELPDPQGADAQVLEELTEQLREHLAEEGGEQMAEMHPHELLAYALMSSLDEELEELEEEEFLFDA